MNGVIGSFLPFAVGIAVSPVPIIAAILMLMSPKAKSTASGFLIGWLLGILVAATAFTFLSALLPEEDGAAKPIAGVIQIVLGVLLLALAARKWRGRPRRAEPELPKWMRAIDTMRFPAAFGLAFLLSAVNPKNLIMAASAGLVVGSAGLTAGEVVACIVIFTALAGSTVLVPVVGYLIAADSLRAPLDRLRTWLTRENATIMAILLLVLSVSLIGKGIGSF